VVFKTIKNHILKVLFFYTNNLAWSTPYSQISDSAGFSSPVHAIVRLRIASRSNPAISIS